MTDDRRVPVPLPPAGYDRDVLCMLVCGYERAEDGEAWISRAGAGATLVAPGTIVSTGIETMPISRDDKWALLFFEQTVEMTGAGDISADMEDARGQGFIVTASFMCATCGGSVSYSGRFADAITGAALLALGWCHTDGVSCGDCAQQEAEQAP